MAASEKMKRELEKYFYLAHFVIIFFLTLSWRKSLPYRNHSIDLHCKPIDWFLLISVMKELISILLYYSAKVIPEYCKALNTAEKMKFSIVGFFGKCDQTTENCKIWSYLLMKSLTSSFLQQKLRECIGAQWVNLTVNKFVYLFFLPFMFLIFKTLPRYYPVPP